MNSSLHPLASTSEVDLGAFLYAMRRLPAGIWQAAVIVMGQEAQVFERAGVGRIEEWDPVEAPARRRRWFDSQQGTMAVMLASTSDLDDLIPTLVAYQVEWNKLHAVLRASDRPEGDEPDPAACAEAFGGAADDWIRIREAWGGLSTFLDEVASRKLALRIRMLGGSQAGYARMTRPLVAAGAAVDGGAGARRPAGLLRLLQPHSIVNLVTPTARSGEAEIVSFIEQHGPDYLREELERFRAGRAEGSWENFLYYGSRLLWESLPEDGEEWRQRQAAERALGVTHISSRAALRVSAQIVALDRLDPAGLDPRLGTVDAEKLAACSAVVVNIEYPLGLAAYNILREVTSSTDVVRGVYVLGKAATLNADVGDVLISGVIHDEHSGSTYWLDNAFSFDDIAPFLRFGSGLDNQRAVTVRSTFLRNREHRLLLPRGLHGIVDGGRAVLQRRLDEIADAEALPVGAVYLS